MAEPVNRATPSEISVEGDIPMGYPLSPDLLMWEMTPIDTLTRFQYSLQGRIYDENKKKYVQIGEKLINDEGTRMIIGFVGSYLSKDKILTDLSENQINGLILTALEALIYEFVANHDKYGIKSITSATIIRAEIEGFLVANLNRSIGGRTLDHQKPMIKRIESISAEKKKRGFFSFMPFFGGE